MIIREIHAKDKSICGCLHAEPGDAPRQISLADGAALCAAREAGGLCSARFDANLHTEGLDYHALQVGERLVAGEALLEITQTDKRCFAECILHREGRRCQLPGNIAFARVLRGGAIHKGDVLRKDGAQDAPKKPCAGLQKDVE